MNLKILFAWLLLSACGLQSTDQNDKKLNKSLSITQYGAVSVLAIDISTKEVFLSKNPQQRMTPASLTKVLTSGAALDVLTPEFRFETRFYLKEVDEGSVLLVKGGGDPTLGSDRFEESVSDKIFKQLLVDLKEQGIESLHKICVDNSCYSGIKQPSKRLWEDIGNYYGAVPNGLSYRENTFHITMQSPEVVNAPVKIIKTEPIVDFQINCLVKSADNSKDSAYIYGNAMMDEWYVSGTIPRDRKAFTIKGALPHPELFFANDLRRYLETNGIEIEDIESTSLDEEEGLNHVYTHYSPKLNQIISVVNKTSHNLFADHLLYAIAEKEYSQADWDKGTLALTSYWKKHISEFTGQFYDGSGLSPFNTFSATDMVNALVYLYQSPRNDEFIESLSIAGVDGTLRSICKEQEYKGKLLGKSGSMNGVLTYCGYINTNEGRTLAFCMMANRFTEPYKAVRTNMEQLMKELIDQN